MTAGRLGRAYRETGYEAAGEVVRLGRRVPAAARLLARLGVREAGFVTAWNPLSRRHPPGWNRRMQRAFRAAIRRWRAFDGHGVGRGWAEAHVLVGVDRRRLLRLARRFRQRAIVLLGPGGRARVVWVSLRAAQPRGNLWCVPAWCGVEGFVAALPAMTAFGLFRVPDG